MKPDAQTAMRDLIVNVKTAIPFDLPESDLCSGSCRGCSKKLLDFLDMELEDWQRILEDGDSPSLGDIDRLAKRSKKIYSALKQNGLV
jgi:hypothetical protein